MVPHGGHKKMENTINLQPVDVTVQTMVDFSRLHHNQDHGLTSRTMGLQINMLLFSFIMNEKNLIFSVPRSFVNRWHYVIVGMGSV